MNSDGGVNIGKSLLRVVCVMLPLFLATACASVDVPDARSVHVPAVTPPLDRYEGLNERRDPVTRVRLGRDMLMPQPLKEDPLPDTIVGPFELRGETLASALELILDDYDISLAFETDEGLKRHITISNLHGKLKDVVSKVCSLADLYCHFEDGTMTIKNTETFVVDLPPIGTASSGSGSTSAATSSTSSSSSSSTSTTAAAPAASGSSPSGDSSAAYAQIAAGLKAVIGTDPTIDSSTRVMIYTATQRSNKYAQQYFERLRKNTALIIFETHIWEVTLNNDNRTGINWTKLFGGLGDFSITSTLVGDIPAGAAAPITITPAYTGAGSDLTSSMVLKFISERGTVKTVSQPQITVLSGSSASLAVSQLQNYVSGTTSTASTVVGGSPTVTATTATVSTGLTMSVTSAWDQSTVYGMLNINLNDLLKIDEFHPDSNTTIQLPQTTTRSLQTEIRVRPGDAILIGGMVSEKDNLSESGPGLMKPMFATSRVASKINSELVFLLRPRVVAFVMGDDSDTPAIADAPKEQIAPPDITDHVKGIFGQGPSNDKASLPEEISPEAFAPENAMPADAPTDAPIPLSVAPANSGDDKTSYGEQGQ
jgi:hypothetical protein